MVQKLHHELLEHLALLQALAILGEGRRIPHRIIRRQSDKPAIKQVVVQLLHQLTFRTDAVENLKQQRAEQALRRNRWPALLGIEPRKARAQLLQHDPDELTYPCAMGGSQEPVP